MGKLRTIVVIDDDEALCEALVEQFTMCGEFAAFSAESAARGLAALKEEIVDLVILDVNLPDMDGREVCKAMRRAGFSGPVIMLTGQGSDADTVLGLEAGANDYVVKPFKFSILLARIRAQLRQHEQSVDVVFKIGPYAFRPSAKLLIGDDNRTIRLTEKEASILKYLYRAGDQVVGRDILLREVWGYHPAATTHTIETHIYRLRQKLEPDPDHARFLVTEGGGYKLIP